MKRLILLAMLLTPLMCAAQLASGVIDPSRSIDWTSAGVSGGIPARATICQTVSLTSGSGNAAANTSAIQSAIASCSGTNQTVSLPSGTYYINGINFGSATNVTVRGQGADSTFLLINSGASGCNLSSGVCFNGPNNSVGGEQNVCDWTAGYSQGATSITVANCGTTTPALGSLSNMHVGTVLVLDQVDESADTGYLWNCASNGQAGDANCATTVQAGFSRTDGTSASGVTMRAQQQTVTVTGISGSTISISPGLYMANWRSGQKPQAWYGSSVGPTGDGIENLTLDNTAENLGSGTFLISFSNVKNDWASGVRGLYGGRDHVVMQYSQHITVQHSYFYQGVSHATVSYAIENVDSADDLVQNNICQQVTDSCPNTGGAGEGNVALYNFAIDDVYTSAGWMQAGLYQHAAGDVYGLWEGNIGPGYSSDDVHGTHHFETLYRNYLLGNQNAGCGSAGTNTCTAETIPIQMWAGSRYFNVVGNVLGRTGYHTSYQYNGSASGSGNPAIHYVYALGATGNSGNVDSGLNVFCTSPSCSATGAYDPQTYNTIMKWGNFDTATNAVRWCGNSSDTGWSSTCSSTSEIPTGLSTCPSSVCNGTPTFSNAVPTLGDTGAGQGSLPPSLYYAAKPSWWPSAEAWPPIGPDVTGGAVGICSGGSYANMPALSSAQCTGGTLIAGLGGHVGGNPALSCYLNTMGGAPDGTGSALSFNASACYGAAATYTLGVTATHGSVSGTNCSPGSYTDGTSIGACTATPNSGYVFTGWSGTGSCSAVSGTGTASCTLTSNSTLTAAFSVDPNACTGGAQCVQRESGGSAVGGDLALPMSPNTAGNTLMAYAWIKCTATNPNQHFVYLPSDSNGNSWTGSIDSAYTFTSTTEAVYFYWSAAGINAGANTVTFTHQYSDCQLAATILTEYSGFFYTGGGLSNYRLNGNFFPFSSPNPDQSTTFPINADQTYSRDVTSNNLVFFVAIHDGSNTGTWSANSGWNEVGQTSLPTPYQMIAYDATSSSSPASIAVGNTGGSSYLGALGEWDIFNRTPVSVILAVTATHGTVSGMNCASATYTNSLPIGPCTATPDTGYSFAGWSGTGSAFGASGTGPYSFTLSVNSTLTATFATATYTLGVTATHGTVSGSNCSPGTYNYGTSIGPCSATPAGGYVFAGWSGTGSGSAASGRGTTGFTISADSTLTATFTAISGNIVQTNSGYADASSLTLPPWTNNGGAMVVAVHATNANEVITATDGHGNQMAPLYPPQSSTQSCDTESGLQCYFLVPSEPTGVGSIAISAPGASYVEAIAVEGTGFTQFALENFTDPTGCTTSGCGVTSVATNTLTTITAATEILGFVVVNNGRGTTGVTSPGYTALTSAGTTATRQIFALAIPEASAGSYAPVFTGVGGLIETATTIALRTVEPTIGAVQWTWGSVNSANSLTMAYPYPVRAGDLLKVHMQTSMNNGSGDYPKCSDSNGNRWFTEATFQNSGAIGLTYYWPDAVAGATTVTCSGGSGALYDWAMQIEEDTGTATTNPYVNATSQWAGSTYVTSLSTNSITIPAGTYDLSTVLANATTGACGSGWVSRIRPTLSAAIGTFAIPLVCDQTVTPGSDTAYSNTFTFSSQNLGWASIGAYGATDNTAPYTAQTWGTFNATSTMPAPIFTGHWLLACGAWTGASAPVTISDTLGNYWTKLYAGTTADQHGIWVAPVTAGGTDAVSLSNTTIGPSVEVSEIANVAGVDTSQHAQTAGTSGASVSSPTLTTTQANDFISGCVTAATNADHGPLYTQSGVGWLYKAAPSLDYVGIGYYEQPGGDVGSTFSITNTANENIGVISATVVAFELTTPPPTPTTGTILNGAIISGAVIY